MSAKFSPLPAAGKASAAGQGPDDWGTWLSQEPAASAGSACCCPARPAVRVVMPPCPARSHTTELLLCAHHYRASRAALTAARAVVRDLPGTPDDIAAWIDLEHAGVPVRVG
ncbi:MAG TPA: hypothetical protein VF838_11760 [Trebonia sp.]